MSAFSDAIDLIFTDGNIGEDALWRAGGSGPAFNVRIIRNAPDETVRFGSSRAILPTVIIAVRVSDVAQPAAGDTVEIADTRFEIIAEPTKDRAGLVWGCEAIEQFQVQ